MTKGPLVPSNSTICPRNGPKRRQKAPKTTQCAPAPRNQERAVSWATWLKNEFRGHLVHPQPPTFCGFQASKSPNETRRPPYQWSLGAAGGPASPRTVGAWPWCPCQIQVLSQKLTGGAPEWGRQVGRCPPKTAHFVPQNNLFWPKPAPKPSHDGKTKANGSYTPRAPRLPLE